MASSLELSPDAVLEIMSRVPLQTLSRCRLLSRACRDLTYECSFMQLHNQRTRTISGYFIQSLQYGRYCSDFFSVGDTMLAPKLALDFLPGPVTILASTKNGLLLCISCYPQEPRLYVCKPTTRQWMRMPNPNRRFFGGQIGMIVLGTDPLRFKVVRVWEKRYYHRRFDGYNNYHIQVFDSDKWAWKQLETVVRFPSCEFPVPKPVSAGGALHWLTNGRKLFSFDGESETWEVTSLPSNLANARNSQLVEWAGKLGIMLSEGDSVELWVLEEDAAGKIWRRKERVEMEGVRKKHGCCSARGFYGSDVALILRYNRLIFHGLKTGRDEVVRMGKHTNPEAIFFFQSDFERVRFSGMEKKKKKTTQQSLPGAFSELLYLHDQSRVN